MDTFIASLIIIFIVLAVLLAVSAYFPYYPEGVPKEIRVIYEFTAGNIGFSENYISRTQDFGSFGVGIPQQSTLKSVPRMEIMAALFSSSSEQFTVNAPNIEWVKSGSMSFTVDKTNKYGNLIILWNGAELYNDKASEGTHKISLTSSQIKEENTLQILAQGPGMLFWASTVYKISSFELKAEYGPAKFIDFTVSQDELESLDKFDLSWFTASRSGILTVKVNGENIYSASPQRQESVNFTDSTLITTSIKPGTNRLTFVAVNGSFELQDVMLNTRVSKNQRTIKERFDVKESQLNSLRAKGGVVRLYVESIENDGELRVKFNEQGIGSAEAKSGWNSISFKADALETGSNWVEISGTGTFDVGDVSIALAS